MTRAGAGLGAALLLASAWAPAAAAAQGAGRVRVEVVDVSGDRAWVRPGAAEGLGRGASISIGRRRYRVVGATQSYAAIELADGAVGVGDRGVATRAATAGGSGATGRLASPRPLSAYRGQWPQARLPAQTQDPAHVPLGTARTDRSLVVALGAATAANVPLADRGASVARGELRARVHAEPFRDLPLALDVDAALQIWAAEELGSRRGAASQPYVRVRELAAALGDRQDLFAALGRLRYAAATLGTLDGLRLQSPSVGGLTLAAFGGFVPDPLDGRPAIDASRFGVEATYRALDAPLRPTVSLVGHASRYDGALDERRLGATFAAYPGRSRFGAHVEVDLHDADDAWGAPPVELSAAGADGHLRLGALRVGARVDVRRPERSRWLAAHFPDAFLCVRVPQDPSAPPASEPCDRAADLRQQAGIDLGVESGTVAVSGGATAVRVGDATALDQLAAFALLRLVRLPWRSRADLSVMTSHGAFFETWALRVGAGIELLPGSLDLSVRYRPALSRYDAQDVLFVDHTVGGAVLVTPSDGLDVALEVDALVGEDAEALLLQAIVAYRPLP